MSVHSGRFAIHRSRLWPAAAAVLAAILAGSCSEHHRLSSEEALIETSATKGHPIGFVERHEALDVELPYGGSGLSRNQYADVYRFALRYREEGTGPLEVTEPGGRHRGRGSSPAAADVRSAVAAAGVDPARITTGRAAGSHVISLAYRRPVAVAPECGNWPRNVGHEPERVPYPDFGCATQRNLAGMVANPRDFMMAQAESPASSERRSRVWSRYVSGGEAGGAPAAQGADASTEAKPKATKR